MSHLARPHFARRLPVYVTLRLLPHVYQPRSRRCFARLRMAFLAGGDRFGQRLLGFSVQGNHIHLVALAKDSRALACGMQGLTIRMARGSSRVRDRHGPVFADRFHAKAAPSARVAPLRPAPTARGPA